ncbi:MAG: nucleotide exchange factor GrpE [Acidobacteriaceae bacterium]|nr:nucleotide exchange factor GrpE [Acidobacteriaceae bacterium]
METLNNSNGVFTEDVQRQNERSAEPVEPEAAVRPEITSVPEPPGELERLAKEKAELQDLLQRRQAEFDNYRRRVERERSDLFEYAAMDSVKALLAVLDDFQRALKVETADKEYARGVEMIYQRFYEALKKLGLEPVSTENPVFNPHIHNAVDVVDTKDHPDQTILEEYQPGYYFKGRLLRPAMVKVANNQ